MATKVIYEHDPEEAKDWLYQAPDKVLACRGQGHAWPKLRPGRVPRGVRATRQHDGCYEIVSTCRDCGMERRLVTLPTGDIDHPARYSYVQPEGYKAPKGVSIARRECFNEAWRRRREELALEARQEAQARS